MTETQQDQIRRYAAGDLAWRTMRDDGWTYSDILSGLGALGLRAPHVRPDGPNAAALARGMATMRMLLARQPKP